jgi:glutamyl-tRNA synthetase
MPEFAHLPLLLKPEGNGKLSKRDGDRLGFPVFPLLWTDPKTEEVSSGYRETGYFPEAVANMLALLGWHPSDNREVFDMPSLIEAFSLEKVSKSGAKFDLNKALWFNHHYLMEKSIADVANTAKPALDALGLQAEKAYFEAVCALMREKVSFAKEIPQQGKYFFTDEFTYNEDVIRKKWKADTNQQLLNIASQFEALKDFNAEAVEASFKASCEAAGLKTGDLMQPLRVAVSGEPAGPPVFEMIALLGQENAIRRIRAAAAAIQPLVA